MPKNVENIGTSEYGMVVGAAQAYSDGLKIGSVEGVASAFHKDAVMYGFTNGELLGGPISNLYRFVETNGKASDIVTHIDVQSMTPTSAVVRVDMEQGAISADYTDFHELLKQNGMWKIIPKTYHQYDA